MNDTIRTYHKYEIASQYGITCQTLRRWIKPHLKELKKLGYKESQKILTVIQVSFIYQKFGRP